MQHSERHNPYLNKSPICLGILPGSIQLDGSAARPPISANADSLPSAPERPDPIQLSRRLDD